MITFWRTLSCSISWGCALMAECCSLKTCWEMRYAAGLFTARDARLPKSAAPLLFMPLRRNRPKWAKGTWTLSSVYKCLFSNFFICICSHRLSSLKLVSLRRHSTFWSMKMGVARETWPCWSQGASRRQVWASRRRKGQVREAGIGGWGVYMCGGILCMMRGVTDSRLSTKTESERYKDIVLPICMWIMEKLVEERKTTLVCLILHWNGRGEGGGIMD